MLIIHTTTTNVPVSQKKATMSFFSRARNTNYVCVGGGFLAKRSNKDGYNSERHALIIENRWPVVHREADRCDARNGFQWTVKLGWKGFVHIICSALKTPIVRLGIGSSRLAIIENIFGRYNISSVNSEPYVLRIFYSGGIFVLAPRTISSFQASSTFKANIK